MPSNKWIPHNLKKGALSRQLGVPEKENLPVTYLRKIHNAPTGAVVKNPTYHGVPQIRATPLVKRRVNFALNVRK
jgi:IS4 transposase